MYINLPLIALNGYEIDEDGTLPDSDETSVSKVAVWQRQR
jgi:hypothetical protein